MIWKKEKLRATQPYFVLDTEGFTQEVYLKQGISHFYTFRLRENQPVLRVVPDGCIDYLFSFTSDGRMRAYVCGTVQKYEEISYAGLQEVFGVRFLPGVHPAGLSCSMNDVLEKKIPMPGYCEELSKESDFYQRIRVFLRYYTRITHEEPEPYGKAALVESIRDRIYATDGNARIADLAEETGYTERYIDRVFGEEMGFSPKTFCRIIRFQRTLEFLNYGAPDSMTDAATALGYFDQAQMIRDFKTSSGVTPYRYLKLITYGSYRERVHERQTNNESVKQG